jgi:hypothetical protein
MRKLFFTVLLATSQAAFADMSTNLLDLGGIGGGSSISFDKDILIPAGEDYVAVFRVDEGPANSSETKTITGCTIDMQEPSKRLRKIPANFKIMLDSTEKVTNDKFIIRHYNLNLDDDSLILGISCARFKTKESMATIRKTSDIFDLEIVDGSWEEMSVMDLNARMSGLLKINVPTPQELNLWSVDDSERSETKDLDEDSSEKSSSGSAKQ